MPLTATVNIVVPDLPDASVWFANAAAWKNYWRDIEVEVEFEAAENAVYNAQAFDSTIGFVAVDVAGDVYNLVPELMFNSLKDRVNVMETSFRDLRTAMKEAGFIENAQ